uniref:Uncharacterized protein n=1 Tax=Aegilops tauschii subsp. strangulata TaxID=200361 RepID=A0A453IBL1_AEGTS
FSCIIVSQDSMRFVQQVVSEDYSKVKGIPQDCLEIMVWGVDTTPTPAPIFLATNSGE